MWPRSKAALQRVCLVRIGGVARLAQETPCESLFDGLHDKRWVAALGFAEQEMYVLGHNHVTYDDKTIALADLLQDLEKQIAIWRAAEQWTALVATRGDEVQVSGTVVSMESVRHGGFVA